FFPSGGEGQRRGQSARVGYVGGRAGIRALTSSGRWGQPTDTVLRQRTVWLSLMANRQRGRAKGGARSDREQVEQRGHPPALLQSPELVERRAALSRAQHGRRQVTELGDNVGVGHRVLGVALGVLDALHQP